MFVLLKSPLAKVADPDHVDADMYCTILDDAVADLVALRSKKLLSIPVIKIQFYFLFLYSLVQDL